VHRPPPPPSPRPPRAPRSTVAPLGGLLLLGLLACPRRAAGPDPNAGLPFASAELDALAHRLHGAAVTNSVGWAHEGPSTSGSGPRESWCLGLSAAAGCWGQEERRGVGWRSLAVEQGSLHGGADEGDDGPVIALSYEAGLFPEEGDWAVRLRLDLAQDPAEDDYDLVLLRLSSAGITDRVTLSRRSRWPIAASEVELGPAPGAPSGREELRRALASPQGLQSFAAARLGALDRAVQSELAQGHIRRCAYGQFWGEVQPRCDLIALSPADQADAARQTAETLRRQADNIRADAALLLPLLQSLLPIGP
jgi:hypothetical protein